MKNLIAVAITISLFTSCTSSKMFNQIKTTKTSLNPVDSLRAINYVASVNDSTDFSDFLTHEADYYYEVPFETVWNSYNNIGAIDAWSGEINSLGLTYSKKGSFKNKKIKLETVFLVNIKLFKRIKVNALFKVVKVDEKRKIIKLCYSNDRVSKGYQTLSFSEENGLVKVKHTTVYKSPKKFRDKYIYPHFHEKCIDEYHNNVLAYILKNQPSDNLLTLQ